MTQSTTNIGQAHGSNLMNLRKSRPKSERRFRAQPSKGNSNMAPNFLKGKNDQKENMVQNHARPQRTKSGRPGHHTSSAVASSTFYREANSSTTS